MNVEAIFSSESKYHEIHKIIRDHWLIVSGEIKINADMSVDILGDIRFPNLASFLKELPLKFNKVSGDFDCSALENLTSLKGSPVEVGGTFNCSYTNIKSLKYAPEYAGRFVFDNTVASLFTGNLSCKYDQVYVVTRNTNINSRVLSTFLEHIDHLPLIIKYQYYFEVWNVDGEEFNAEGFENLLLAIEEGLQ